MNDDILTIPEVGELLRVAQKTVYSLAQKGELPAFKIGGQWRFSRTAIESWIAERTRSRLQAGTPAASPDSPLGLAVPERRKAKTRRRR